MTRPRPASADPILDDMRPFLRVYKLPRGAGDADLGRIAGLYEPVAAALRTRFPEERGYRLRSETTAAGVVHSLRRRRCVITVALFAGPAPDWVPYAPRDQLVVALDARCDLDTSLPILNKVGEGLQVLSTAGGILLGVGGGAVAITVVFALSRWLHGPPAAAVVTAILVFVAVLVAMPVLGHWGGDRARRLMLRNRSDERHYDEDFLEIQADWHAFLAALRQTLPAWLAEPPPTD